MRTALPATATTCAGSSTKKYRQKVCVVVNRCCCPGQQQQPQRQQSLATNNVLKAQRRNLDSRGAGAHLSVADRVPKISLHRARGSHLTDRFPVQSEHHQHHLRGETCDYEPQRRPCSPPRSCSAGRPARLAPEKSTARASPSGVKAWVPPTPTRSAPSPAWRTATVAVPRPRRCAATELGPQQGVLRRDSGRAQGVWLPARRLLQRPLRVPYRRRRRAVNRSHPIHRARASARALVIPGAPPPVDLDLINAPSGSRKRQISRGKKRRAPALEPEAEGPGLRLR